MLEEFRAPDSDCQNADVSMLVCEEEAKGRF